MASTLKINNLDTASGTTITVPTGKVLAVTDTGGLKVPGTIVQVTDETRSNDLQITINNSSSNTAITAITTTITPKFAGSKILINMHTQIYGPSGQYLAVMIFRSINIINHTTI